METYKKMYNTICRLCLKSDKSDRLVNLFEKSGTNELSCYGKTVATFAKVLDSKSDKFPTKMCHKCLLLLNQAVSFKNQCEESERRLKNISSSSSSVDTMIQEVVECSLFWQHFPENTTTDVPEPSSSPTTELSRMEEMVKILEFNENYSSDLDVVNDGTSDNESEFLLDIKKNARIKTVEVCKQRRDGRVNLYCYICKKAYKNQSSLFSHMKKHNLSIDNDPDLFMDIMQSYLKRKIDSKESANRDDPVCKICNKLFSSRQSLFAHMKRHTIGSYVCEHCGKTYATNSELQVHLLATHKSGQGHKCDYCDYKSLTYFHLKEHIRLHTGERPFTCEKCGLTFRRQYIYRKHLLLHGDRNIKCPDCPRKFYRKGDMLQHRNNIHERIYMFGCPQCGATYAKNSSVRRHLTERHGVPRELQGKITRLSKNSMQSFTDPS